MWHASVRAHRVAASERALRLVACAVLDGAGDAAAGEWCERGAADVVHLRRRLSRAEQALVGPALDVRGTEDGALRAAAAAPFVPPELCGEIF